MAAAHGGTPWRTHESHHLVWIARSSGLLFLLWPIARADAQGVTTGAISGVVKDAQGAVIPGATVIAVHEPSGSTYEAVTQADGRFVIPGMRVGGPYTITAVAPRLHVGGEEQHQREPGRHPGPRFRPEGRQRRGERSPSSARAIRCSARARTGAATAVMREDLATLPTITGRITDITRLTPQYGGSGSFAGQDNRANNITVDGAYFNNSFGLGDTTGGIGDRTGVAPISLEAIEQVQVNVAPYDVRQGNFTGANVNTVTRSGTNQFTASVYYRTRNENCGSNQRRYRSRRHAAGPLQSGQLQDRRRQASGSADRSSRTSCSSSAGSKSRKTRGR